MATRAASSRSSTTSCGRPEVRSLSRSRCPSSSTSGRTTRGGDSTTGSSFPTAGSSPVAGGTSRSRRSSPRTRRRPGPSRMRSSRCYRASSDTCTRSLTAGPGSSERRPMTCRSWARSPGVRASGSPGATRGTETCSGSLPAIWSRRRSLAGTSPSSNCSILRACCRRVWRNTGCAARPRCSPPGLRPQSRPYLSRYGHSLRPCLGTSIAPWQRALFRQTLLGRRGEAFDRLERPLHLGLVERHVLEFSGEVVVVGGHVEVAVAREVEEDRLLLTRLVRRPRGLKRAEDRAGRLRRWEDPLASRELDRGGEAVALEVGLAADPPVAHQLGDQRRDAVVAQPAGVDRRRDEVVPERVHRNERRQLARIAEVVGEEAACEGRAGRRLAGEDVDVAACDLLADERERKSGEVRPAADAADHDVGEGARLLHLRKSLLADHRLVQEDVVQHGAERVGRVLALRCVLDRLRDRDPETARRVRMLLEHSPPGLRVLGRARDDLRAPRLDERAPERLLVVRDPDHVDLALESEERAGEGERRAPLAGARLCRKARPALPRVVVGLRDRRVRLVAAGRADALVLVEDPRASPDRLLEPPRPVERSRAPEAG